MTIVWTRGLADWAEDRALLAGIPGIVHVPCVRLVGLEVPSRPTKQFSVYIVASPHTFAFYPLPLGATVHTFGARSAAAARSAGAHVVHHEGLRSAAELIPILLKTLNKDVTIGIPGAAEPAVDLVTPLRAGGFQAEALPCYQTEAQATKSDGSPFLPEEVQAFVARLKGAVVCFASPSAVDGFVKTLPGADVTAACIGPTTARAAAAHFPRTATAPENTLASLAASAAQMQV